VRLFDPDPEWTILDRDLNLLSDLFQRFFAKNDLSCPIFHVDIHLAVEKIYCTRFQERSKPILTFNGRIQIWPVMKLDSGIHHEGNIRGGRNPVHVVSTYST
jgi:hypothetical protein